MQICKKMFFFIKNITKHDIRTIAPGVGDSVKDRVSFRIGAVLRQLLRRTIPPWLEPEFGLGLVLGLGVIFLGGYCPRTKKHIRDYIQLYSPLSVVYSEHFFFFYNIFFTKSKMILLILLKTFLLACCIFT